MHTSPEVLALLALGEHAAEPAEQVHLATCPQCRAEVDSLTQLIDQSRATPDGDTLDAPSEAVWAAIQTQLGFIPVSRSWPTDRQSSAAQATQTGPGSGAAPAGPSSAAANPPGATTAEAGSGGEPRSRGRRVLSMVLAATLALIAGIGIGLGVDRLRQPSETIVGRATLEARPNWPGATGSATVEQDATGNRILVVTMRVTQPTAGVQQVWLIDPTVTAMRPIGFLDAEGHGNLPIPSDLDLAEFPVVDVSDEPADDTDLAHSGDSIVRGELSR